MRQLVRNAALVYGTQAANAALSILYVPVALQALGREGYGLVGIYGVVVLYLSLAELGVGKNLLRLVASEADAVVRTRHLSTAFSAHVAVAVALLLLLPVLIWAVPLAFPVPDAALAALRWIVVIAVAEYVIGLPIGFRQAYAMAEERFDRYSRFVFVSGAWRFLAAFAVLVWQADPVLVVAAMASRRLPEYLLASLMLGRMPHGTWRLVRRWSLVRAMFAQSAWLLIAQLLQITVMSAGAVLVNAAFGLMALGTYRAVFDLVSKVWLLSNVVATVLYPRFVRMYHDPDRRSRLGRVLPAAQLMSWTAYSAMGLSATLLGAPVLRIFGMQGAEFLGLFVLMAVATTMGAHASASYELVIAAGRYGRGAGVMGLALALMLIMFAALVTPASILAIGWAWLGSQVVFAFCTDGMATGLLGVSAGRSVLAKLGLLAVVGAAMTQVLSHHPPPPAVLLVTGFAGIAVAAGRMHAAWSTLRQAQPIEAG